MSGSTSLKELYCVIIGCHQFDELLLDVPDCFLQFLQMLHGVSGFCGPTWKCATWCCQDEGERLPGRVHNGTGTVVLVRAGDTVVLRFDAVALTNAPDVHVYLSRDTGGKWSQATSVYLGPLKATNGSFNYTVPAEVDLTSIKSVVVWCRQFSVLVTWVDLR